MAPRQYRLGKRAAAMEETRRRIVLAAVALHAERGIAATSMKDIAKRADVGEGTVYYHFQTYEDVLRACGVHLRQLTRPPTPELFEGLRSVNSRIDALVRELFAYYERYPQYERARCDQDKIPVLAQAVQRREDERDALVREALRDAPRDELVVKTLAALTDFAVYRALTASGMSTAEASLQIQEVIQGWLARHHRTGPSGTAYGQARADRRARS